MSLPRSETGGLSQVPHERYSQPSEAKAWSVLVKISDTVQEQDDNVKGD